MDIPGYKGNGDPDGTYWMGALRKGLQFRKKVAYEGMWKNWEEYYRGNFGGDILPVNIFFKLIRTMVPRVYFRDPTVSITQEEPGQELAVMSQILERVDNKLLRKMGYKGEAKMAVQDACMYGTGFIKLGFGAQYTPAPEPVSTTAPQVKKGKNFYGVEYHSLIEGNMPWALRVHPSGIVIPDKCMDFKAARWIMHLEAIHIDDLRSDPRFKHTEEIEPAKPVQNQEPNTAKTEDIGEGMIQLAEIRDKKSGKVFVMAPYHSKKILLEDQDVFTSEHGHFPIFPVIFNRDPRWAWGIADSKVLDPQQREINEVRTQEMKHRRHAIVKMFATKDALSPDESSKIDSEGVGAVVIVDAIENVKPQMVVNQFPAALLEQDQNIQRETQELIGLGQNQFGEYAPGSADRSATEAQIVNQATQIRMDERRDAVADVTVEVVNGMHTLIFENWTDDQVVDVVGDDGSKYWVKWEQEFLRRGLYDVNIDPDSGLPQTAQMRSQKATETYQLLRQDPNVDQYKNTSNLLRERHGPAYDDLLKTPQEMQQMAAAQAKQQKVMTLLEFAKVMKGAPPGQVAQAASAAQ